MDKVYSNSRLNLSALAAADTSCNLYASPDPHQTEVILISPLDASELSDDGTKVIFVQQNKRYRVRDASCWTRLIQGAPLNSRGWVVQERTLARRLLHFGHDQIFWECREKRSSEGSPDVQLNPIDGFGKDAVLLPEGPLANPDLTWRRIIEYYSGCNLTFDSDKLVAISGLAKRIGDGSSDVYMAGLWRQNVQLQLCWYTEEVLSDLYDLVRPTSVPNVLLDDAGNRINRHSSKRPARYRSPFFSGAAIDSPVTWPIEITGFAAIAVKDVQVNHVTRDVYGAVTGGHIDLTCVLKRLLFSPDDLSELLWGRLFVDGVETEYVTGEACFSSHSALFLDDYLEFFDPRGKPGLYCFPGRFDKN